MTRKEVKILKYLTLEIFILLSMKVSTIQPKCTWDPKDYCTIRCFSYLTFVRFETIMAQLEQALTEVGKHFFIENCNLRSVNNTFLFHMEN